MAKLSEEEKKAFIELSERGYVQSTEEKRPLTFENTPEGRARYVRWATEMAKFYKGEKPVRFVGNEWKL
ncbi:MAG: hypothetical protein MK080_06575 [Opitutales bacterium]|nr:hypothetical protein [Opitutales bacterium]NRA26693.1 hypothetical protein [Opitutales bacterium]